MRAPRPSDAGAEGATGPNSWVAVRLVSMEKATMCGFWLKLPFALSKRHLQKAAHSVVRWFGHESI